MALKLDRREFLKSGMLSTAALVAGGSASLLLPRELSADPIPDVVIVYGNDPANMARSAVDALGGIKSFVKPGNKVFIKPNMSFARKPGSGCNTNPLVVREIARLAAEAGAAKISILDNVLNNPSDCLSMSQIPALCQDIPNTVVNHVRAERLFREVKLPQGTKMKSMQALGDALDADVLISVPVGKSHSSAGVSLSMKGMMGLVHDRVSFHSRYELHEAIVDMVTVLKPHLVVIDGTRILSTGGPGGPGKVIPLNCVVASTDMVAADAQMLALGTWYERKFEPTQVKHIKRAAERGLGRLDLGNLNVKTVKS